MPITKSAIKKARQDKVSRVNNRVVIDAYKKSIKTVKKLVAAGDKKKAQDELKNAYSKIDIAAKKNLIHKNNASRKKSLLSKMIKEIEIRKVAPKKPTVKKESKKN